MKTASIAIFLLLSWISAGWSQEIGPSELSAAVLSEDLGTISIWLTPQRIAGDADWSEIADLFVLALEHGKSNVVSLMLKSGVDLGKIGSDPLDNAVYVAAESGNEEILSLLQENGWTPQLSFAIEQAKNVPPQGESEEGSYFSSGKPWSQSNVDYLIERSIDANPRFLRLCLDTGLSPDYTLHDQGDESLLNQSVKTEALAAFKLLIGHNANIKTVTILNNYKTTLALAIELHGEGSEYVSLLREKGAFELHYTNPKPNLAQSATDRLRIRSSPNLSGAILGYLMKDDPVQLLEVTPQSYNIDKVQAPWIKIKFGNIQGWGWER